jgi:acetolactate synthase regulatory subunit
MHLHVTLTDHPAALPRLVSCLCSHGWAISALDAVGTSVRLTVSTGTPAHRVTGALDRLVDVLSVRVGTQDLPTRTVVVRQRRQHRPVAGAARAEPWCGTTTAPGAVLST